MEDLVSCIVELANLGRESDTHTFAKTVAAHRADAQALGALCEGAKLHTRGIGGLNGDEVRTNKLLEVAEPLLQAEKAAAVSTLSPISRDALVRIGRDTDMTSFKKMAESLRTIPEAREALAEGAMLHVKGMGCHNGDKIREMKLALVENIVAKPKTPTNALGARP
jgi:hypothetical protein